MIDTIKKHIEQVKGFSASSAQEVEAFRIKYLGKKGLLNEFFKEFKNIPNDQKKEFGQTINTLKQAATDKVSALKQSLEKNEVTESIYGDLTRPGEPLELGARHPISIVKNQIISIFSRIGFNVSEGPEIEDDWHNFTALNLPEHHPARDMQDTFFIQTHPDILLRTHTSSCRYAIWKITTLRYVPFHRGEYIEMRLSRHAPIAFFTRLKDCILTKTYHLPILSKHCNFLPRRLFGKSKIRLRPSYFPLQNPVRKLMFTGDWKRKQIIR